MDIASLCSLHAAGFVWQPTAGSFTQTVMVKATFRLEPLVSPLAPEQEPLNEEDNHWNDDPTRSVVAPSDWAPFKPCADVLLVGHAFAPEKRPERAITVRMVIGELDKSIEVWCDRGFRLQDNQLLEGPRFTKMPLRWERAAGGPETNNPLGMRFDAPPDKYGMVPIPNLQPPGMYVSQRSDTFIPMCFAPLGSRWPGRIAKLGRLESSVLAPGWEGRPLPEGLDYSYFQSAPSDQQVSELRANERIVLDNLHPEHSHLVTSLPDIRPKAVVERATGEQEEVALIADTLFIDTDRGICTLVWRGRVGLRSADEKGQITVSIAEDAPDSVVELGADELEEAGEAQGNATEVEMATMTLSPSLIMQASAGAVMPFAGGSGPSSAPDASRAGSQGNDAALPFGQGGAPSGRVQALLASSLPASTVGTLILPEDGEKGAVPPVAAAQPLPAPPAPPAPAIAMPIPRVAPISPVAPGLRAGSHSAAPAPAAAPAPPPLVNPPPLVINAPGAQPAAIATPASPWARGEAPGNDRGPVPPGAGGPSAPNAGPAAGGANSGSSGASSGAVGASNAAAAAAAAAIAPVAPWSPPKRSIRAGEEAAAPELSPTRELIQLVWFDPESVARIRRVPAWKELVANIGRQPRSQKFEIADAGQEPWEAEDRREVFEIIARGTRSDAAGVVEAMHDAIDEDGKYVPPLVLLGGDLELPFDELSALKAALSTAAPLVTPADEGLKASVGIAKEFLQTPGLSAAPAVCEGLTNRIREAFSKEKKALPADYIDTQMERVLLSERQYQKRKVFGGVYLRVLVWLPGEKDALIGYLPQDVAEKLPAYRRFGARVVVEVHPKKDQYEVREEALRVVALGVVTRVGRKGV